MSRFAKQAASPLARAIHLALLGALASPVLALPGVAMAQVARFDIAPGPLGLALSQFAARAGVTFSFPSEQTQGLTSPGLQGEYSVDDGLARLLEGSGLQARRETNGGYVLMPRAAASDGALELTALSISGRRRAPPPKAPAPTPPSRPAARRA